MTTTIQSLQSSARRLVPGVLALLSVSGAVLMPAWLLIGNAIIHVGAQMAATLGDKLILIAFESVALVWILALPALSVVFGAVAVWRLPWGAPNMGCLIDLVGALAGFALGGLEMLALVIPMAAMLVSGH